MSRVESRQDRAASKSTSGIKTAYLIFYNTISAGLWSIVLLRTASILLSNSPSLPAQTFNEIGEWTKWTQTLAGLEVLHALLGIVRAPLMTTIMQVSSRFLLVWAIAHNFPAVAQSSYAYSTMLLAWGASEVIRYSFFAVSLSLGRVPAALTWLRYSAFYVLYPLGISSECWLVFLAQEPARKKFEGAEWVLRAILLVYIPGSYILFTHMMSQRRKVMKTTTATTAKKSR